MTTNEAAERLRRYLAENVPEDEALADLELALAAERRAAGAALLAFLAGPDVSVPGADYKRAARTLVEYQRAVRRATVERIRLGAVGPDDKTHDQIIFVDDLERILDEEAAR